MVEMKDKSITLTALEGRRRISLGNRGLTKSKINENTFFTQDFPRVNITNHRFVLAQMKPKL